MRFHRRTVSTSAAAGLAMLAALGSAAAQTSGVPMLAIEREPPGATRPVAPAPILVPQPSGPPMVTQAPVVPAPVVVPPGPSPVAVPEPARPGPMFVPEAPKIQGTSQVPVVAETAPAAPKEAAPPAPAPAPTAPAEPPAPTAAPVVPPPVAAPSEPPAPGAAPAQPSPPPASPAAPTTVPPAPTAPSETTPPAAPETPKAVEAAPQPSTEEVEMVGRPVLFVTGVTTWDQAEEKLGGVFAMLAQAAKKLGITDHGGPLVEYIESDSDDVGFRAMLPISSLPKGKLPKGVKAGQSPSGKALKFRHNGPLDDLEEVYGRIDDELAKRGVEAKFIVEQYDEDALASPEDRVVVDVFVFVK